MKSNDIYWCFAGRGWSFGPTWTHWSQCPAGLTNCAHLIKSFGAKSIKSLVLIQVSVNPFERPINSASSCSWQHTLDPNWRSFHTCTFPVHLHSRRKKYGSYINEAIAYTVDVKATLGSLGREDFWRLLLTWNLELKLARSLCADTLSCGSVWMGYIRLFYSWRWRKSEDPMAPCSFAATLMEIVYPWSIVA